MASDRQSDEDDGDKSGGKAAQTPRRSALTIIINTVLGTTAVAAAGVGFRAWQSGAGGDLYGGSAYDPWREWEAGAVSGPEGVIAAAVLAPSPHNSQPWRFVLRDSTIDLQVDGARHLGVIDPVGREMLMGLGCALENMVIGARALGFTPIVSTFPEGQGSVSVAGGTVARIILYRGDTERSPEAAALARRHTHRGPYVPSRIPGKDVIDGLNTKVQHPSTKLLWLEPGSAFGKMFADGTIAATEAFVADAELHRASLDWFRTDLAAINAASDGIAITAAGLSPAKTRGALMVPASMLGDLHARWIEDTRLVHVGTAPMYGVITVNDLNDKGALLEAGRLWQRLHLAGTVAGLAMQPLNQMMEVADRDRALKRPSEMEDKLAGIIGFPDAIAAFGFRMGYAERPASPSPRRAVKLVMSGSGAAI